MTGASPTRASTAAIRQAAGIEHLFLVGSHTHHGPVIELDDWPTPKDPYVRRLEEKLVGVILQAAKDLRPAALGVASREVTLNRSRLPKGAEKPVDRELLVLRVHTVVSKAFAEIDHRRGCDVVETGDATGAYTDVYSRMYPSPAEVAAIVSEGPIPGLSAVEAQRVRAKPFLMC